MELSKVHGCQFEEILPAHAPFCGADLVGAYLVEIEAEAERGPS